MRAGWRVERSGIPGVHLRVRRLGRQAGAPSGAATLVCDALQAAVHSPQYPLSPAAAGRACGGKGCGGQRGGTGTDQLHCQVQTGCKAAIGQVAHPPRPALPHKHAHVRTAIAAAHPACKGREGWDWAAAGMTAEACSANQGGCANGSASRAGPGWLNARRCHAHCSRQHAAPCMGTLLPLLAPATGTHLGGGDGGGS